MEKSSEWAIFTYFLATFFPRNRIISVDGRVLGAWKLFLTSAIVP
jgi:hypothetical protein